METQPQNKDHSPGEVRDWIRKWKTRLHTPRRTTPADRLAYEIIDPIPLSYLKASNIIARNMLKSLQRLKGPDAKLVFHPDNINTLESIIKSIIKDGSIDYAKHYKGVFLFGNNSSGKSFALITILKTITALEITKAHTNTEYITIRDYKYLVQECKEAKELSPIYNLKGNIMIDDLGYRGETSVNIMGTKSDILTDLVYHLHKLYLKGSKIYITSNYDLPSIIKIWGKGTHDRIVEMTSPYYWNIIDDGFRVNP